MGKKKGKSVANDEPSVISTHPALTPSSSNTSVSVWQTFKNKGNSEYQNANYKDAIDEYTVAIEHLLSDDTITDKSADLSKLYGNRSSSYYQLSLTDNNSELLKKALADGHKAVEYDAAYEKGHFRCAMVLLRLKRKVEAIEHMTRILGLYRARNADYRADSYLVQCLVECKYASATKQQSSNWSKVKFKNNCIVVDPLGAGDHTCISQCFPLILNINKLSVLVKPGKYIITSSLMISNGNEVNIIGDISDDQQPSEVIFQTSDDLFDAGACHIFCVFNGGKLKLENVSLRQQSKHAERHAIFAVSRSEVILTNCLGYSRSSGLLAVNTGSRLLMSNSTVEDACAALIVTTGSYAVLEHCIIKNTARIGLEARDDGFIVAIDCEISKSGSQGLVVHAGALGFVACRCIFYGNCCKLPDQYNVVAAAGAGYIDDCQVTTCGLNGGGVMVQEGGCCEIINTRITGGKTGIGFSLQGSARLSKCYIADVQLGLAIVLNQPADIVMDSNFIVAKRAEIMITDDDIAPKMHGSTKHEVFTNSVNNTLVRNEIKRQTEQCGDQPKEEMVWRDPRCVTMPGTVRTCAPCGLTQHATEKYFKCSACRLSWYCSKECQLKDWPIHKAMCAKIQEIWKPGAIDMKLSDKSSRVNVSVDADKSLRLSVLADKKSKSGGEYVGTIVITGKGTNIKMEEVVDVPDLDSILTVFKLQV